MKVELETASSNAGNPPRREAPRAPRSHAPSIPAGAERLFGKYDELVRMLLGVLLTGLIGTYLSHRYTTEQAEIESASKIFSEHSKLIGERYFAQRRLSNLLRSRAEGTNRSGADVDDALAVYREKVQEWNSARGYNREMIKLYFGNPLWNAERDVHYAFRAWGEAIEAEVKKPGEVDFACLEEKLNLLLEGVHALRVSLARALQQGAIGRDKDMAEAKPSDRPKAYCVRTADLPPP
jgi:hypothetical protein